MKTTVCLKYIVKGCMVVDPPIQKSGRIEQNIYGVQFFFQVTTLLMLALLAIEMN